MKVYGVEVYLTEQTEVRTETTTPTVSPTNLAVIIGATVGALGVIGAASTIIVRHKLRHKKSRVNVQEAMAGLEIGGGIMPDAEDVLNQIPQDVELSVDRLGSNKDLGHPEIQSYQDVRPASASLKNDEIPQNDELR